MCDWYTEEQKSVSGTIDLLVLLNLLVNLFVSLFTSLALLGVRLGGAAAKAAHDSGPGQRVCGLRMRIRIGPAHRIDHARLHTTYCSAFCVLRFQPSNLWMGLHLQSDKRRQLVEPAAGVKQPSTGRFNNNNLTVTLVKSQFQMRMK